MAHDLVYFGESLGAAVAIELAVADPPTALVLRSPFTSLADIADVHYPFLPARALLRDEFPSLDRIGGLTTATLVIAGSEDSIVPIDQSRAIFAAAPEPERSEDHRRRRPQRPRTGRRSRGHRGSCSLRRGGRLRLADRQPIGCKGRSPPTPG